MEEGRLAYRVRTADASDAVALRDAIGATLAHPDPQGRRASYNGAASRGDILVLERYDRTARDWQMAGFVECHLRVDDNLSIRDIGTPGDEPQIGAVRYLLDQAFNSFRPVEAQVKIRRDAGTWLDIFRNIPGFYLEGEEYRRPHYWTIWRWDRQRARDEGGSTQRSPGQPSGQRLRPRPPTPSTGPAAAPFERNPRPTGPGPNWPAGQGGGSPQRGSRPGDTSGGVPSRGPRPTRPSGAPPRPARSNDRPSGPPKPR